MKKILNIVLCIILSLSLAACGVEKQEQETQQTIIAPTQKPDETITPDTQLTDPDTTPTNPQEDFIELSPYKGDDNVLVDFDGKIELILETKDWFTFYSDDAIYRTARDTSKEDWVYYLHKFELQDVKEILYYHWDAGSNMFGRISDETCVYVGTDDKIYASITAESDNPKESKAKTVELPCSANEFQFIYRDVDIINCVFERDGKLLFSTYDFDKNAITMSGELIGKTDNGDFIQLKKVVSNCSRDFAITHDNVCHQIDSSFDFIDEDDGKYYVELHEKIVYQNVQDVVTHAFDNLFIAPDDTKNLYFRSYSSDGITNVKIQLPESYEIDDITDVWGCDDYCVVEFENQFYYVIEEIDAFETEKVLKMNFINMPVAQYAIVDFAYEDFELVVLLSDGNVYICEDAI